jgi:BirA family biotin operon repressor/biotin-[acetyl-CoA-carboxylase] ligase
MKWKIIHIAETDSTNRWLREYEPPTDDPGQPLVVWADYQTAGKGQGTNRWESERDKNLLFSILYHPLHIQANRQFTISMAISLAIVDALEQQIGDVCIKWPNDIYWRNGKLGGILIENTLKGNLIKDSIIGVGLNVNQREFHSDAPNPVSLWQITGQETDREQLLKDILQRLDCGGGSKNRYMQMLYRRKGFHPYTDKNGVFMAEITGVMDDGHLLLTDDNGKERVYAFKEVTFII